MLLTFHVDDNETRSQMTNTDNSNKRPQTKTKRKI